MSAFQECMGRPDLPEHDAPAYEAFIWNAALEAAIKVSKNVRREGFGGGAYNEGAMDVEQAIRKLTQSAGG